ncbi:uncharacterized mitochondrial protein-like protein [Tanacetum coccineum]
MDYKRTKEYLPKVHRTRQMDDDLRESYRTLEKRLFHEGRIVTPSFIAENNMLPFFQAIGLEPFLTLNEPICPRFVVEFYHSLEVKRNEEDTPYIEFKLETFYSSEWSLNSLDDPPNSKFFGPKHDLVKKAITVPRTTRAQLLRDPNTLYVDDIRPDLKGWELFFKENFFCSIDKRNKVKACTAYMLYYLTIGRKFNFTSMIIYRMEEVIKKRKAGLAPEIRGMLRATQPTTIQNAILRAGILTDDEINCGTLIKGSDKRKGVEESSKTGGSWKEQLRSKEENWVYQQPLLEMKFASSSTKSFPQKLGPKLNRALGQVGNQLPLEGSRNNRSNGNQIRGRAFNVNVNAMEAIHIVNPGYVIEVADGKKVEVNRIIRDFKLELESSLFSINLIPLGHGSFDVIMGRIWLTQHKAVIVCHEKVVEIPVEDVEFRLDLVPGATPIAKSPYRLAQMYLSPPVDARIVLGTARVA